MKHSCKTILFVLLLVGANSASALFVSNMPVNKIQPNGDTIHFFVTGDEFYHRYHDADNYTIVQNRAGYWVYATAAKDGSVQSTEYRVGQSGLDPKMLGLVPGVGITQQQYLQRRREWEVPEQYRSKRPKTSGRNHGDFCNLVIFIRFADDSNYTRSLESVDRMFSDSSRYNSNSVYNYFKRASYNKLFIRTYYAPAPSGDTIRSYQSPHPRSYFMPYTDDNPMGYTNSDERRDREFDLLESAVNWINDSAPVPTSYNLDCNNDGQIDNVNFVVRGTYTGWSDLLWPHKWNLYSNEVYINQKKVNTFNLALEGAGDDYFGTSTFSHEMFHSLSAPDLYHYSSDGAGMPVGVWDLMASNSKPPQHSLAWVKYRYGNWLDSIPTVTQPGVYTLRSNADSIPGTMALKFPSAHPDQYYVVEYRDNTEIFEKKLPGKGIIIYRVDTRFEGNASFDGTDRFNEIWVFRPDATSDWENGSLAEAYFTPSRSRTEFSPSTNPYPYLSDGTRDLSFAITSISTPGNTVMFRYTNHTTPVALTSGRITSRSATLDWQGIGSAYRVYYRPKDSETDYIQITTSIPHITLVDLDPNKTYEWTVRALYDPVDSLTFADSSGVATQVSFHTALCGNPNTETIGSGTTEQSNAIPFAANSNYNYFQQLFTADEINGEKSIGTISFHYAHTTGLDKPNCIIYLGHTTQDHFDDTTNLVPFDQLQQVYAGAVSFVQGWNELVLDTPFYYNGTDNLVLAIDDNSGQPSRLGQKFYVGQTASFMARIISDNNANPDPAVDSALSKGKNVSYRINTKFTGCPDNEGKYYACIISDNEAYGVTSGDGLYDTGDTVVAYAYPFRNNTFVRWSDGSTDNPKQLVLTSDTLLVAYFHSHVGIGGPQSGEGEGGYVVTARQLSLCVSGADGQPVRVYDLMGRLISSVDAHHSNPVSLRVPVRGIYLLRVGAGKPVKLLVTGM